MPPVGKSGPGTCSISSSDVRIRIVDQRKAGVDHLAQIVRRDVRRHAHRDSTRAVDQHVREPGRKDRGLRILAVVIGHHVDGVFFDIGEEEGGGFVHPHFGVAHGRGVIAIHRAEIALSIQQGEGHGEILRHPDQRLVNRQIAVRVVLAHHVTHGSRAFSIGFIVRIPGLVHRIEDAAMDRLQAVAQVGDGAGNDDRHRVVEERCPHLVDDRDSRPVMVHDLPPRRVVFTVIIGALRLVAHSILHPGRVNISLVRLLSPTRFRLNASR